MDSCWRARGESAALSVANRRLFPAVFPFGRGRAVKRAARDFRRRSAGDGCRNCGRGDRGYCSRSVARHPARDVPSARAACRSTFTCASERRGSDRCDRRSGCGRRVHMQAVSASRARRGRTVRTGLGQGLILVPTAIRLVSRRVLTARETVTLITVLTVAEYLVWVCYSPAAFTYADELRALAQYSECLADRETLHRQLPVANQPTLSRAWKKSLRLFLHHWALGLHVRTDSCGSCSSMFVLCAIFAFP